MMNRFISHSILLENANSGTWTKLETPSKLGASRRALRRTSTRTPNPTKMHNRIEISKYNNEMSANSPTKMPFNIDANWYALLHQPLKEMIKQKGSRKSWTVMNNWRVFFVSVFLFFPLPFLIGKGDNIYTRQNKQSAHYRKQLKFITTNKQWECMHKLYFIFNMFISSQAHSIQNESQHRLNMVGSYM